MAKKKRPQRSKPRPARAAARNEADLPTARVVNAPQAPAPAPAFWFGFEVSWAKLLVARVVIFGILALDAVLQVRHAPRYGASDFNVANLGFLDSMGPGRVAYGGCQLAIAALLTFAVFGVATRYVLPVATVLYAWLYFGSQLDSYQHHYLVALVLAIACFVPWQRPSRDRDSGREMTAPSTPVRSWALRLLLVELGIMYLWAAISKLDTVWLDGTTLSTQIVGGLRSMIEGTVGFAVVSVMVIVIELTLAFTVWLRPAWKIAAPLGLLFHLGIVATGFEIGLFAYVMLALYILVIPDRIWRGAAEISAVEMLGKATRAITDSRGQIMLGLLAVVGVPLVVFNRLPHARTLGFLVIGIAVVAMTIAQIKKRRGGAVPAAALAVLMLWTVVDRSTTVAIDYYRFWGGSQRRIGDRDQAERAYRGMLEIEPTSEIANFYLGRILLADGRDPEGLERLHDAQHDEPRRARAFVEEARWLATQGKRLEAIAKAKDAVFADPSDAEAKAFFDSLQGGGKQPNRPKPDDDL